MLQVGLLTSVGGNVQKILSFPKGPSSKAAALLASRAYFQYVSTAKGRKRRWRLFSTFPYWRRSVAVSVPGFKGFFLGESALLGAHLRSSRRLTIVKRFEEP